MPYQDATRQGRHGGKTILAAVAAGMLAAGCGGDGGGGNTGTPNTKPANIGTVKITAFDGNADDLLTAGLGKDGLAAKAPAFADPLTPTAAELRRNAIHVNYNAIVDTRTAGGYGSLYGPNVDAQGNVTGGQGKIAGVEYLAFSDDGSGQQNVTMLVQIPATFSTTSPCVITATSSGSRGVYGGISTGEWGLKRGCAVAYTDKGTGAAPHDLDTDTVPLIDGTRATRTAAGKNAQFVAQPGAGTTLADFTTAAPHRMAFKHAHSQRNPEKDWGTFTLQAVDFAIWAINDRFGTVAADGTRLHSINKDKILVIASSVSNGGGAAIAAAEQDTQGLIDGVAVSEPNVNLPANTGIVVRRGGGQVSLSGRTLYDYTTTANLLQLCASQSPSLVNASGAKLIVPAVAAVAAGRCQSLANAGIISGVTTSVQADDALAKLRAFGWEADSDDLHPSLAAFDTAAAVSVTFANALARASVTDRLCGYSFAAAGVDFKPAVVAPFKLAAMYSTGNGVPPNADVALFNDNNPGGPFANTFSVSPSTSRQDANFDGANCLRKLLTGADASALALQTGLAQTLRTGNLRGKPALIVHGRNDALLPVNHTSRPYLGFNKQQEGAGSKLSYIEVENAQHFDGFIDLVAGYDIRYIPLHVYLNRALDAVFDNLRNGKSLPPSQVVRTVPRGGIVGSPAPAILPSNVPPIAATPGNADRIVVNGNTVEVPN